MQVLKLSTDNRPDGPCPHNSGGHSIHDFKQKFQIVINLTTEQFFTLPQPILEKLWFKEVSGSFSHMASSLHDRALT